MSIQKDLQHIIQSANQKLYDGPAAYKEPKHPTRKQHLVPQYIVSSFATTQPFYVFNTKTKTIDPKTNTEDVCTHNNEYEMRDEKQKIIFRNLIERDFLSQVEGLVAPIYRSIVPTARFMASVEPVLSQRDNYDALFLLISMLILRSPTNWVKYADACRDVGVEIINTSDRNASLELFMQTMPLFVNRATQEYGVIFLRNQTEIPFVLSSRPSYMIQHINIGMHTKAIQWTCPFSPDILVLVTEKENAVFPNGTVIDIQPDVVQELNKRLVNDGATEQFVSTNKIALQDIKRLWNEVRKQERSRFAEVNK